MWVRRWPQGGRVDFLQISDMQQIKVDRLPVPTMAKDEEAGEWYEDGIDTIGIFFNIPDGHMLLIEFDTFEEANESLCNLFRAWSACRSSLYLIPQGTSWAIEAVGKLIP